MKIPVAMNKNVTCTGLKSWFVFLAVKSYVGGLGIMVPMSSDLAIAGFGRAPSD